VKEMKKIKSLFLFILAVTTILALTACGSTAQPAAAEEQVPTAAEPVEITLTHKLGEATVQKNPQKVVVFDYATLDTLDAMGIEVIGLPKSNIPEFLTKYKDEKYEDVGTLFEPNYEKLNELKPDVIFISTRQASVYEELKKIAPTVYFEIDQDSFIDSFGSNLKALGEIFGKEDYAEGEIARVKKEVEELSKSAAALGKNALVVMVNEGALSAYGEGSRFGMIHKEFGFVPVDKNIEVSNHGQSISFEYILEKNPDYVFVIDRGATVGGSTSAQQVLDNDLIKMTEAYKNENIIYLDSQVWYVASGGVKGTDVMIKNLQDALK
jgi:iron complex transport system substrate-binding protein